MSEAFVQCTLKTVHTLKTFSKCVKFSPFWTIFFKVLKIWDQVSKIQSALEGTLTVFWYRNTKRTLKNVLIMDFNNKFLLLNGIMIKHLWIWFTLLRTVRWQPKIQFNNQFIDYKRTVPIHPRLFSNINSAN